MPYEAGRRLGGERASRLGHLDVLRSELVRSLCENFEDTSEANSPPRALWEPINPIGPPLRLVFAVDGSLQVIENELPPHKTLAFVKTSLLRVDRVALDAIDSEMPHPYSLRDLLRDSALYHATVFPMRHVRVPGVRLYDAVRRTIFDSVRDPSLDGEPMETLKWLAYEKWDGITRTLPEFQCPHCDSQTATLQYDQETGDCPACKGELFLTDMLGFHLEMSDDGVPDSIATAYMLVHETLLLLTGVKYFWEKRRDMLAQCLFLKDGPLAIRAQYSKLVQPIRRFFAFARDAGVEVAMVGQEKTGAFVDHLSLVGGPAPAGSVFVPGHQYIREEIQFRPVTGSGYGFDTNYGAKVFVKLTDRHQMVLSVPTGPYVKEPAVADLIGFGAILASLPTLMSARYEGGLFPIELAHNVASLSTYPSAKVLSLFSEAPGR